MVLLNFAALAISLLLLAALLAITGTQLSALSLLCVPLLLGLVIDYSLHVLMALEHDHGDFRQLYAHIGAPILLTGLASCIGFGAPMLTSQPALQNFGLVMDLGILSAVTTCLFLLPVLARLTARR
jgi:predicted RND superfamily exporter protein